MEGGGDAKANHIEVVVAVDKIGHVHPCGSVHVWVHWPCAGAWPCAAVTVFGANTVEKVSESVCLFAHEVLAMSGQGQGRSRVRVRLRVSGSV